MTVGRERALGWLERYALVLVFVAVLIFFSLWGETSGTFPTSANIKNVLGNQAVLGVLSLAIMFPLVCGEFDFSVGGSLSGGNVVFGPLTVTVCPSPR